MSACKCAIKMQFEAGLVELADLLRNILALQTVVDKQLRDKIDEDECACAGAKGHMLPSRLNLQSSAHGAFDVKDRLA